MIVLYHVPGSRSMRSLWLLHELARNVGLAFDVKEMAFDLKVLRSPEYLAVHPLGRVPCLVDDGRVLFESGAICQYICERYDDGVLSRGPDHPERMQWLQWVHFAETMGVHGASLVQQSVFIAPAERSPAVKNLESRRLEKTLGVIDRVLAERDYLLDSGFSAADTMVGYSVHLAKGFVPIEPFRNVTAYYARLADRPAFQAARGG